MAEALGIKETKELLDVAKDLTVKIIKVCADGVQAKDAWDLAMGIMRDQEFQGKVVEAVKGISQIPAEVRDLDVAEGIELGQYVVEAIIAELKAYGTRKANAEKVAAIKAEREAEEKG